MGLFDILFGNQNQIPTVTTITGCSKAGDYRGQTSDFEYRQIIPETGRKDTFY